MKFPSTCKFSVYTMIKLPVVWLVGVRLKKINAQLAIVSVKHRWINQNPFKSMFWGVQGMAAELATGGLVVGYARDSGEKISMLVVANNATFIKKATGRINFVCNDGDKIKVAINKAIETREGQTCWMKAIGTNSEGVQVSEFNFEWTVKVKG